MVYLPSRFRQIFEKIGLKDINALLDFVVQNYDKSEIYALLPPDLRCLAWSCRKPIYEDGYAKPCNSCSTCNTLKKANIIQESIKI